MKNCHEHKPSNKTPFSELSDDVQGDENNDESLTLKINLISTAFSRIVNQNQDEKAIESLLAIQGSDKPNEGIALLLLSWIANSDAFALVEAISPMAICKLIRISLRIVHSENVLYLMNCLQKLIPLLPIRQHPKEWECILKDIALVQKNDCCKAEEQEKYVEMLCNICCSVFIEIGSIQNWKLFRQFVQLNGKNALYASACQTMVNAIVGEKLFEEENSHYSSERIKEWDCLFELIPNSPFRFLLRRQSYQMLCVFEALAFNFRDSFLTLMTSSNEIDVVRVFEKALKAFCLDLQVSHENAFNFDYFLANLVHEWIQNERKTPFPEHCCNFLIARGYSLDSINASAQSIRKCLLNAQERLILGIACQTCQIRLSPSLSRVFLNNEIPIELVNIMHTSPREMQLTNGEKFECCEELHVFVSKNIENRRLFIQELCNGE